MIPIDFSIRYSIHDGCEHEALSLARRLFAVYDTGIDSLSLVPTGEPGVSLYFNGRLIVSHQRDGRAPTVADVRTLFSQEGVTVVRRPGSEAAVDDNITLNDGNIAALTEAPLDRKRTP